MNIKRLNDTIEGTGEVKGFTFTKAYESDAGYVYKVDTGCSTHFEAIKRDVVPVCVDFEKRIFSDTEAKERYPKAKDFGKKAWSVRTLEEGINRLT